jgi:hypothetical protein
MALAAAKKAAKPANKRPQHCIRRTRLELENMRKAGDMRGFFGHAKVGRPTIIKTTPPSPSSVSAATAASSVSALSMSSAGVGGCGGGTAASVVAPIRKTVNNWASEDRFPMLCKAVMAVLQRRDAPTASFGSADIIQQEALAHGVPRQTLARRVPQFFEAADRNRVPLDAITAPMIFCARSVALLDEAELELLMTTINYRDEANTGMSRHEVVSLIMEIVQNGNRKKCEDHYDYLIRSKKLPSLKQHGRVVLAQARTTKHSQIMVQQQLLRWHTTVELTMNELRRLNQPTEEFDELCDHFFGNTDETCYMANADGGVRVIASASKKKTEKISDDCRASVTSLRLGMASGTQGPFIFLAKGKSIDRKSLRGDLHVTNPLVPKHSRVIMTPNVYMNDEVYGALVEDYCKGIRAMPVIRDHPEWWCCITLDGFGSHVNVHSAQDCYAKYKIFVIKEEGDTSQVNQAYDQVVAKRDKKHF